MIKFNKVIFGSNTDAKIFALFNPHYQIITHPDFGGSTFKAVNDVEKIILDSVVFPFKNEWMDILFEAIDLKDIRSYEIEADFKMCFCLKSMVIKKLTDQATKESISLSTPFYANKKIVVGKSNLESYDIPMSIIRKEISKRILPERIYDLSHIGNILEITSNKIIGEYGTASFSKAISTVNAKIMKKLVPGSFSNLKSLPTTLVLLKRKKPENKPSQRKLIYYSSSSIPYNRINCYKDYIVLDITGNYEEEDFVKDFENYNLEGKVVIPEGKISSDYYHSLPSSIEPLGRFASFSPEHRLEDTIKRAVDNHNLYSIWQNQKEINCKWNDFPIDLKDKEEQTRVFVLHMIDQATSLLSKVNWKKNKKQIPLEYSEIAEEWIDMFKYWLSIGQVWEITPEDFLSMDEIKTKKVLEKKDV